MDSARHLLKHGDNVLRSSRYIYLDVNAILTTLSVGVDKALKLALALWDVAEGNGWPSVARMKNEYEHGVVAMDAILRNKLRAGIGTKPYARDVLAKVDADPIWPALLTALDAYGDASAGWSRPLALGGECRSSS